MYHDAHMQLYIPPTTFHPVTGTWANAAGNVAHTIVLQKTAGAETATVSIPLHVPGNSLDMKGSMINSVEVDYEILAAVATSITATIWKVARGVDGAVAVATQVTATQDLTAATDAADVDQHNLTITITTPEWIADDEYWLVELACVCGGSTVLEFLGAQINYTARG